MWLSGCGGVSPTASPPSQGTTPEPTQDTVLQVSLTRGVRGLAPSSSEDEGDLALGPLQLLDPSQAQRLTYSSPVRSDLLSRLSEHSLPPLPAPLRPSPPANPIQLGRQALDPNQTIQSNVGPSSHAGLVEPPAIEEVASPVEDPVSPSDERDSFEVFLDTIHGELVQ